MEGLAVPVENHPPVRGFSHHRVTWADFEDLARGAGGAGVVQRLRYAERSRRLLLLRALIDEVTKYPDLCGPLPSPESAWELLARAQEQSPSAFDLLLAHPYTGTWAGYTTRLLSKRITGVCPLWVHIGHLHALAAAAAIRAGLNFLTEVPLWDGGAMLPTLGLARLNTDEPWSVAEVRGDSSHVEISNKTTCIRLPYDLSTDTPEWWGIRQLVMRAGERVLSVRLDDLDPYRGLYEPVRPQRFDIAEVDDWCALLGEAWHLIVRCLPDIADALPAGLDSLVPRPTAPFRMLSASTGEAFGSAIVSLPSDAASLAAILVHEFQHIRLGGLLHLIPLLEEDYRERFYTGWRDDPRPIGGVLQGVYAFFGVTAFWRALIRANPGSSDRRAAFEFAYWRGETWRTLCTLRADHYLTQAGRRFVDGIAERLGPWQDEPVPEDTADMAAAVSIDHYAGWRLRYLRPAPAIVTALAEAWLTRRMRPLRLRLPADGAPTPVPDGSWSRARADLSQLAIAQGSDVVAETWHTVPDATVADFAYVTGRFTDAARGYCAELSEDPDRPASWVGLGLALSAHGTSPAARTLLRNPELVRAVHRKIRAKAAVAPPPRELADWVGRSVL